MKTIKKAILILASVISLSVICGCKQESHDVSTTYTREYTNKCHPIESFKVEDAGTNKYHIIADEYEPISNGTTYIYYNTTDDLKSAKQYWSTIELSAETQNIGTYYFWGYIADYNPETNSNLYKDPRKSGITPKTFSYKFENEIPYPENLKVKYSKEILNKIVVTWDPVKFYNSSSYNKYYLYTNTENDISSAKKVKHKKYTYSSDEQDYFDSDEVIYEQILLEDKPLYFWIKVYNNGYSDFSEPVFLDFKHKKPDAPTNLTVTKPFLSNTTVTLKEVFPKPEYYKIYYAKVNNFAKAELDVVQSKYFKYTDEEELGRYEFFFTSEFESSKTFYFWIKAADTPDEDANPETESELVGPVSVTF